MKVMTAAALAAAFACAPALQARAADAPIRVAADIPYRTDVGGELIRNECRFGSYLSDSIVRHAAGKVVAAPLEGSESRRLDIVVTKAHAAGGGAISGPKWGRIYGELKEDGRVVGNFSFKRTTSRPFTFRACTTLKLIAEALGGDVARWLEQPTFDPLMTEEVAAN